MMESFSLPTATGLISATTGKVVIKSLPDPAGIFHNS